MSFRVKLIRIPLIFAVLLLITVMVTLYLVSPDNEASAPFFEFVDAAGDEAPQGTRDQEQSGAPKSGDFISVSLEDSSSGSMILVNRDYKYIIPDAPALAVVDDIKTPSYMVSDKSAAIAEIAVDSLNEMMDAFYGATGLDNVIIISSFRTYEKQQSVLDDKAAVLGREEAEKWAALPEHSEHHTGLAVDFGIYENGIIRTFKGEGAYSWFKENSYKYGFILRYDGKKTQITNTEHEPWHFRYVGKPHSYFMKKLDLCLEEYTAFLMNTDGYKDYCEGSRYEVYYTEEREIYVPAGYAYTVSGSNTGGFIVSVRYTQSLS